MTTKQPPEQPSSEQLARRRLLKLAAYTPPAILGVMLMGERAWASSVEIRKKTCGPKHCAPFRPCRPRPTCRPQLCKPAQCKPFGKTCMPKMGCRPFQKKKKKKKG